MAIGAIAGLVGSVVGSALASKKAAREAEKRDRLIADRDRRIENQRMYDKYLDHSQTVTNQSLISQGRELGRNFVERAEGQKAVGLGTDAAVAEAKRQAVRQADELTRQAMINGETAAQQAESQYQQQKAAVDNMRIGVQGEKMNAATQMGTNFLDAGLGLISSDAQSYLDTGRGAFENMFRKKNTKTEK